MSKLSFRARALDASKPMPIYMAEELPDLPDYSAINRAVPQMPSGMEKEEECEHHLQRAICTGLIIPTPEVTDMTDVDAYEKIYPADYKLPRQLIHMQPFAMEQDIPDYDMDSEDEKWVGAQSRKMDLTPLQFEEMMDRLEKSSGQTVVTLNEAKALLKEDDDLIIAVFDYWLNKRLKTQHPLLLTVKTENRMGSAANNPYLAFRRRTEKMQTRKNRKNDETSYEKMLKLRRDISRAVTLLELVKRREKTKREHLHLTIEVYEKRYQAQDFSGQVLAEVSALKASRPAFAPLFTNQFGVHQNWANKVSGKEESLPRKEKRQYKKRKHKPECRGLGGGGGGGAGGRVGVGVGDGVGMCGIGPGDDSLSRRGNRSGAPGGGLDPLASSDEDGPLPSHSQPSLPSDRDDDDNSTVDEGQFAFRRNKNCTYLPAVSGGGFGNWPWCEPSEGGSADKRFRFAPTSISNPFPRCIGLARRRLGRGGRVILDRWSSSMDDAWASLDFTIHEPRRGSTDVAPEPSTLAGNEWLHFRPKTPPSFPDSGAADEDWSTSSDSDSEGESSRADSLPVYAFPPEATSIRVDVELDNKTLPPDEPPFTSEFNISDYFPHDFVSDFDLAVAGCSTTSAASANSANTSGVNSASASGGNIYASASIDSTETRTDQTFGSSRFTITPLPGSLLFSQQSQPQPQQSQPQPQPHQQQQQQQQQQQHHHLSRAQSTSSSGGSCSGGNSGNIATRRTPPTTSSHPMSINSTSTPPTPSTPNPSPSPSPIPSPSPSPSPSPGQIQTNRQSRHHPHNQQHLHHHHQQEQQQQHHHHNQQQHRHHQQQHQHHHHHHHRQSTNHVTAASSVLSKSLTGSTSNRASATFGNGHQNGPTVVQAYQQHNSTANNMPNSAHASANNLQGTSTSTATTTLSSPAIVSSSGSTTTITPQQQKNQASANMPAGVVAQSKLASLARQQSQQSHHHVHQQLQHHVHHHQQQQQQLTAQSQAQQVPTPGEITLNSNR